MEAEWHADVPVLVAARVLSRTSMHCAGVRVYPMPRLLLQNTAGGTLHRAAS